MNIQEREKEFFDKEWENVNIVKIEGKLDILGIDNFKDKKILICSCGTGKEAVLAAKQGGDTYTFDISETAVNNAIKMAEYNNVSINGEIMDFCNLKYKDNYFDIVYGTDILHHVDVALAGKEIYRILKSGGIAFFRENSDRNPILRFFRRSLFGKPGCFQRKKVLFIKRRGTTDEYPITEDEIRILREIFKNNIKISNETFRFFYLLHSLIIKNQFVGDILRSMDSYIGSNFPFVKEYSFLQEILMWK